MLRKALTGFAPLVLTIAAAACSGANSLTPPDSALNAASGGANSLSAGSSGATASTATGSLAPSPSQTLALSFADPSGDNKGTIDVTRMDMTFDTKGGNYQIVLTADGAHPFLGPFRVNINLYDPSALAPYFQDVCKKCNVFNPKGLNAGNDFNLVSPTTTLTMSGKNTVLQQWKAGDSVASSTWAGLGNPPGSSLFRSSVDSLPFTFLTNEDVIGYNDSTLDGSAGVATISVAP